MTFRTSAAVLELSGAEFRLVSANGELLVVNPVKTTSSTVASTSKSVLSPSLLGLLVSLLSLSRLVSCGIRTKYGTPKSDIEIGLWSSVNISVRNATNE